jgi:hypothetical protein
MDAFQVHEAQSALLLQEKLIEQLKSRREEARSLREIGELSLAIEEETREYARLRLAIPNKCDPRDPSPSGPRARLDNRTDAVSLSHATRKR